MTKALQSAKAKAPKTAAEPAKETSGQPVAASGPDAPSSGAATGTNSTDDPPEQHTDGGAGNAAGSAGSALDGIDLGALRPDAEGEFRAKFPRFSAAMEAWQAEHENGEVPAGLRIAAKVDGFRRAGIAHSKSPVDHPVETFTSSEQLEVLFAEPTLKVELI